LEHSGAAVAAVSHHIVSRLQIAGKRTGKHRTSHSASRRDNPNVTVDTQTTLTAADKKKIPRGWP
jgi:hypothetical protein